MISFEVGERVKVSSRGHRHDGRIGVVAYIGSFFGSIGVEIDGSNFGFMPSELSAVVAALREEA